MLLMSRSVWLEKEKSLTQNQELFCNGKVEDAASMGYRSLAALLLSNPKTKVSDLFLSEHFLATDYMLHHRTGAFKIYVWWAVLNSNNLSAKELELLRRAFESATKYKTWMEYMDGKRWLHVALQWEKIFIGLSIEMFHLHDFGLLRHAVLEIVVAVSFDPKETEDEVRSVALAVHANCILLAVMVMDIYDRGVLTGNLSMFIHQLCVELPNDFEGEDVMALVSQRFEHLFFDGKRALPNTNRKSIDAKLVETS